MVKGIYVGLSGAVLRSRQIDVTAENLANLSTPGYKRDRLSFRSYLVDEGLPVPSRALYPNARTMAATGGQGTDLRPGQIVQTGNPLDAAIMGEGFFTVRTEAGERYTRKGSFQLDASGTLRTVEGYEVQGENGPLVVPKGKTVTMASDGSIRAGGVPVGRLKLVGLEGPRKLGDGLFAGAPRPETVRIQQGAREGSNVEAFREMISLIQSMRYFEANQRMIQAFDTLAGKAANELARV